ncbi:MAG: tetratricopeptide repeat protein [Tepidisphaeraceae bacterium]
MKHVYIRSLAIACAVALTARAVAAPQPRTKPVDGADAVLAERFCEMGQNLLRTRALSAPLFQRTEALLEAASRLNPNEARYPRLRAEALLQLKDSDGALAALGAYRKLEPDDRGAQVQSIDLFVSRMETADAKIAYLRDLLNKKPIPSEVRAHAAVRCARLLVEKSQPTEAQSMVEQAIRLNPHSLEALKLRYELVMTDRPPLERVGSMLAMLRANPAQPLVVGALADQLADVGLIEQSLSWYSFGSGLSQRMGVPMSSAMAVSYAAELFIGDQDAPAGTLTGAVLQADPHNIDAWFLKLAIDKSSGNTDAFAKTSHGALNAIANRIAVVRAAAGDLTATTRPIDAPGDPNLAEPSETIKNIQENKAELLPEYRRALGDLAWLQLYYLRQPEIAEKTVAALKSLADETDPVVARLEGWLFLIQGKKDEAKVKLSAVSQSDPLGALGLLEIAAKDESAKQQTDSLARKLLSDNPSGLLGGVLWGALRGRAVTIIPTTAGDAIKEELEKFPTNWLRIIDTPHEFYALRGEPIDVVHAFGQPMMARITVHNVGEHPLTIGPDGVLHQDLWIDAHLRGVAQQAFPGVAYERLTRRLVLRPGESTSQVIRVDQGALGQFLTGTPTIAMQVFATVLTNPTFTQHGLSAAPGGYRVQFLKLMERDGYPLTGEKAKQAVYAMLASNDAADQMCALELLATYTFLIRKNLEAQDKMKSVSAEFTERVGRHTNNSNASVRSWAAYLLALLATPEEQPRYVRELARDELWQKRLLALAALRTLPEQVQQEIAESLMEDSDPTVNRTARAAIQTLTHPTTSPSLTEPTGTDSLLVPLDAPVTGPATQPGLVVPPATTETDSFSK